MFFIALFERQVREKKRAAFSRFPGRFYLYSDTAR
jgi:hypothetical protein